jgi:hypothetical protein
VRLTFPQSFDILNYIVALCIEMEAETSGEYEVEPQNELLGTEVYQSESEDIDAAEDEIELFKQQGSHCFLYSIINCLQREDWIRKFLKLNGDEDIQNISNYENWMIQNRKSHKDEKKKKVPFFHGVTPDDISDYLKHLKSEGVIAHYKFSDHSHKKDLRYFADPRLSKRNENYLLMGYTPTSDKRNQVSNNFTTEISVDSSVKKAHKKVRLYDWQKHKDFSKSMLKLLAPKETKEEESKNRRKLYRILGTVNLHAVAIKFDSTGFPYLLETGRMKPHLLNNDPATNSVLREISFSFPVLYKMYYLKIHFS